MASNGKGASSPPVLVTLEEINPLVGGNIFGLDGLRQDSWFGQNGFLELVVADWQDVKALPVEHAALAVSGYKAHCAEEDAKSRAYAQYRKEKAEAARVARIAELKRIRAKEAADLVKLNDVKARRRVEEAARAAEQRLASRSKRDGGAVSPEAFAEGKR